MTLRPLHLVAVVLAALIAPCPLAVADGPEPLLVAISARDPGPLIAEHVYGGLPIDSGTIYVRQGYVVAHDDERRVPRWAAYRAQPDYLNTPERTGRFSTFRVDPDIAEAPRSGEYTHSGYDRGHLAPYFAMGGDRDDDGLYAADEDEYDARTILQANYMGNIAPQYPQGFNRAPGLWWSIETWIRQTVVREHGHEAWVYAGTIFGPERYDAIGPEGDIEVPPMFFMLVVIERTGEPLPTVLAFLLPHQQVRHGDPEHFLVSVRLLEAMTGLAFFGDLAAAHGEDTVAELKARTTWHNWPVFGD